MFNKPNHAQNYHSAHSRTLDPPETGRHSVLAFRASVAADNEPECSFSNAAQSSRYASCIEIRFHAFIHVT